MMRTETEMAGGFGKIQNPAAFFLATGFAVVQTGFEIEAPIFPFFMQKAALQFHSWKESS